MEEKLKNLTFGKAMLIGLAVAAFYWFSMYDDGVAKEENIKNLEVQIAAQIKERESINSAIADAERFQQKMNELGAEMDRVLLAMPAQLTGLDLMSIISNEAKSVGAEINRINSSDKSDNQRAKKDEGAFYEPVLVEVDIAGTYNQMMLFLSNLTRLDKIITTEKLEMKLVSDPKVISPKINLRANLLAYRYLPKSKGGK